MCECDPGHYVEWSASGCVAINLTTYRSQQSNFSTAINYMLLYWCLAVTFQRLRRAYRSIVFRPNMVYTVVVLFSVIALALPETIWESLYMLIGGAIGWFAFDMSSSLSVENLHQSSLAGFIFAGFCIYSIAMYTPQFLSPACPLNTSFFIFYFFMAGQVCSIAPHLLGDSLNFMPARLTDVAYLIYALVATLYCYYYMYFSMAIGAFIMGVLTWHYAKCFCERHAWSVESFNVGCCVCVGLVVCAYNGFEFGDATVGSILPVYYVGSSLLTFGALYFDDVDAEFSRSSYTILIMVMLGLPPCYSLGSFAPLTLSLAMAFLAVNVTFIITNFLIQPEDEGERIAAIVIVWMIMTVLYYLFLNDLAAHFETEVAISFCAIDSLPTDILMDMLWILGRICFIKNVALFALSWLPEREGYYEITQSDADVEASAPPLPSTGLELPRASASIVGLPIPTATPAPCDAIATLSA